MDNELNKGCSTNAAPTNQFYLKYELKKVYENLGRSNVRCDELLEMKNQTFHENIELQKEIRILRKRNTELESKIATYLNRLQEAHEIIELRERHAKLAKWDEKIPEVKETIKNLAELINGPTLKSEPGGPNPEEMPF